MKETNNFQKNSPERMERLLEAVQKKILKAKWREALEHAEELKQMTKGTRDREGEAQANMVLGIIYRNLGIPQKAKEYHESSLRFWVRIGHKKQEAFGYRELGQDYILLGKIDNSIKNFQESIKLFSAIGDETEALISHKLLNDVINHYLRAEAKLFYDSVSKSQWENALKYGEDIVKKFYEYDDKAQAANWYINVGYVNTNLANFRKAIDCLKKSLEINIEIGDIKIESKCYANLAWNYNNLYDFTKAIECLKKSTELNRNLNDMQLESVCQSNFGVAYEGLGMFQKAIEHYEESIRIKKEIGDLPGEAKCYAAMGKCYIGLEDSIRAIEYYNKGINIYQHIENRVGLMSCYAYIGFAFDMMEDIDNAILYGTRALRMKEIVDMPEMVLCYLYLGSAFNKSGNFKKGIEYSTEALKIAQSTGNKPGEASCHIELGISYRNLGKYDKAFEYCNRALEIYNEIEDQSGEALCNTNLGIIYNSLGDPLKAIEYHKKALKTIEKGGTKKDLSKCYNNLGVAYNSLGGFHEAFEFQNKALTIAKENNYKLLEANIYTNMGLDSINIGEYGQAMDFHNKALESNREIGSISGEAKCYANLGSVYMKLGEHEKAIDLQNKALELNEIVKSRSLKSACYSRIGNAYRHMGEFGKAVVYHEKVLGIDKESGNRAGLAATYANLSNCYFSLGRFTMAIEYSEKSLEIANEIGDKSQELVCYINIGNACSASRDSKKSIEYYNIGLQIAQAIGDLESCRIINQNLSRIYIDHLNRPEIAYECCKNAIKFSEVTIGGLVEEQYKISFAGQVFQAYQLMVLLCVMLKKYEEAFEYLERSKSRAFLDLLSATEIKPSVEITGELQSLLEEEKINLQKLREIQTRHLRQIKVSVEPGETERVRQNLDGIWKKIEKHDPEYSLLRSGKPLSLFGVRELLFSEKRNTVLLEYFTTKDEIYIFVVSTRDKNLHIEKLPITAEKLKRYIRVFEKEIIDYRGAVGNTWLSLSRYFIEPISKYLNEGDLICFVPYGLLHYLPMHALELNGEPIVKSHPIVYSPSSSLIKLCRRKGSGKLESCSSFGVVFEKEAEDVARIFNTIACNSRPITADIVREWSQDRDVIHFSCHGHFDDVEPLSSGVELEDGVLTAKEIFSMRLNTEIVTLSACQTGLNERSPGDELIGLTRAFLYAGAPSVVVSLWSVDVGSTRELMLEYYKLLKKGTDKAVALQEAQKKIMEQEKYSHPYFWAPFVLVGDWTI